MFTASTYKTMRGGEGEGEKGHSIKLFKRQHRPKLHQIHVVLAFMLWMQGKVCQKAVTPPSLDSSANTVRCLTPADRVMTRLR